MNAVRSGIALGLLLLIANSSVRATDFVDNLAQPIRNYYGPIGDDWNHNDFLIGQEFTLPSSSNPYEITNVALLMVPVNGGGGNFTAGIWNVNALNDPGQEVASLSTNNVASPGEFNFVAITNIILSPGIYYAVVAPATPADNGLAEWAYANTTNWAGTGSLESYADTYNGYWTNYTINFPQQISVQGTPVSPVLNAAGRQGTLTTLSWPSALNGYVVDSATNLAAPAWQAIAGAPVQDGSTNVLTNDWSGPMEFFRLRQSYAINNLNQPAGGFDVIATYNNPAGFLIGQQFTLPAGNYSVSNVVLALDPANGGGNITASIWSVTNNIPGAQIAALHTRFIGAAGNFEFTPTAPLLLPGGSYFVVASPTTSADNGQVGWYWTVSTAGTGFGTPGGLAVTRSGTWQSYPLSFGPYEMSVQVTPAP